MNYSDHDTANFSIYARNHVQRGWLGTRFGQVDSLGQTPPEELGYFEHHPPLVALLTSVSFSLFGISEAAARALPILLSSASCAVLFVLARSMIGGAWGLLAALLFALCPGAISYGQMLNPQAFVMLLGLTSILCWVRHTERGGISWQKWSITAGKIRFQPRDE